MKKPLVAILALIVLPTTLLATGAPPRWQSEIISLISHQRYKEAGNKLDEYCVQQKNADLCLTLASAHFEAEPKFGIDSKNIVEAYRYTRLACEYGSTAGCDAYKAAIEKGELLQHVLFAPGVENRESQLKEALKLGANLNSTTLYSRTLLQTAISEENTEALKLLLDNGADINYRVSNEDLTPLMYAVNTGNSDIVTLLLNNGADSHQKMQVPEYLNMGQPEADACDLARKLENAQMSTLLNCRLQNE
ncbi:MAG: ankyrin repeat domain-containing protein [Gammaproteobacteria bacterium]|nr:ankyrin repeat domain-containing protein [Gammaproteobacteria bacterium]